MVDDATDVHGRAAEADRRDPGASLRCPFTAIGSVWELSRARRPTTTTGAANGEHNPLSRHRLPVVYHDRVGVGGDHPQRRVRGAWSAGTRSRSRTSPTSLRSRHIVRSVHSPGGEGTTQSCPWETPVIAEEIVSKTRSTLRGSELFWVF